MRSANASYVERGSSATRRKAPQTPILWDLFGDMVRELQRNTFTIRNYAALQQCAPRRIGIWSEQLFGWRRQVRVEAAAPVETALFVSAVTWTILKGSTLVPVTIGCRKAA
ncbi:MAG: hypothetical protein JJ992_10545 [Planctomycetes bacterium]|jgi:hypothetical protein|nr:hypothetical protein [Planctomycetota bacterium]